MTIPPGRMTGEEEEPVDPQTAEVHGLSHAHTPTHTQTVLVVEDSRDLSSLLATALEDEGFRVRIARNGAEALDLARELQPAVITLDLGLPGGTSGWDVVAELRAQPATARLPIIAVSAHANDLEPAFRAQVTRIIPKPFYLSDVLTAVTDLVSGRRD